ncbi:hypothetical protein PBY51_022507 [Eleginops maclovinus]|uniref:Ig-like domain-containing protein n=1 Tax=Eleginops maclovinus TaxID=56733 RepID=A0AAN8AN44_ELEMC|nr:hypothetical protein PBY51_022507 [Eleginops maclovinus]
MARRYFLSYFFLTSILVAGQSPKYALQGGEVSLKSDITGPPDGILWKHKGNKLIEFDGKEEHVYKPFENRITLDWFSADIHIVDLRFEDSGEYELELEINKKLHRSFYKLEVIDKVATPTISCEIKDDSSGTVSGKLLCSAEPGQIQSGMKFEWRYQGSVQPGPEFKIPLGGKHDEEEYSCTVSNPAGSNTATFTAWDCYPVKSSSVGMITGLGIFFGILLVGLGIFLFCKLRQKACFAKDDAEKQLPPVPKAVSQEDDKKARRHEKRALLPNRESTIRSKQPLGNLNQGRNTDIQDDMPKKGVVKERRKIFERKDSSQISRDADQASEHLERKNSQGKLKDSEKADLDPAGVSEVPSEETHSDLESSIVHEQTENNTEEHAKTESPTSPRHSESTSSIDQSNVGDEDADQQRGNAEKTVSESDPSDPEKEDPDPADMTGVRCEETQSDPKSSVVSEQPEPEKKYDKAEEMRSVPASAETSTVAQPPDNTTTELNEDANSQVTKETKEKNVRQSDSSGEEERNESDHSTEDKQSPTLPEHKGLETTLHEKDLKEAEEETHTSQDNKQELSETVKPVSGDVNKTESKGDCEETDKEHCSPQYQSPTPSNTFQESPDTATAEPDQKEEEEVEVKCHDSDKSKMQSDNTEGEVVKDKHEVKCGLTEEKPRNESFSEDGKEQ